MNITALTPRFAGRLTEIDLTVPLTASQVAAIEAGMDRFAVRDLRRTSIKGVGTTVDQVPAMAVA